MNKLQKWLIVGVAAVGVSLMLAIPAFGEFEASKESKGKGSVGDLLITAGGGVIACQNSSTTKAVTWTVESGGKATTKGADVGTSVTSWGECSVSSSELSETTAKVSECGLEVKQPKTEVTGAITKACTVTAGSCEIKLEPKENENLQFLNLSAGGKENENLFVDPVVDNLATTTNGKCTGISSTGEGKLSGSVELDTVKNTALAPEFTIATVNSQDRFLAGETTTIKITNMSTRLQAVRVWSVAALPANTFSSPGEAACVSKTYAATGNGANSECSFSITFEAAEIGASVWEVAGANGQFATYEGGGNGA
jgi:hypothetical protein